MTTADKPRTCYYIPPDQRDERGFIPSLVTENEPGHVPFMGNGRCAEPWHWGQTYDQARDLAAELNLKDFGLDQEQVAAIMLSSIRASRHAGRTFLSPRPDAPAAVVRKLTAGELREHVTSSYETPVVLKIVGAWLAAGYGVAVYEDGDLRQLVSYGADEAVLATDDPPPVLPGPGSRAYVLTGTYRGEPLEPAS